MTIQAKHTILIAVAMLAGGCSSDKDSPKPATSDKVAPSKKVTPSEKATPSEKPPKVTLKADPEVPTDSVELTAVSVLLGKDGYWVGTSDGKVSKIDKCGDKLDIAALGNFLCALHTNYSVTDETEFTLAGADDVSYQQLVSTMDGAMSSGFHDISMTSPSKLTVTLPATTFEKSEANCAAAAAVCPAVPGRTTTATEHNKATLNAAPVLVINNSGAILLNGVELLKNASADLQPLAEALKKSHAKTPGIIIFQAGEATGVSRLNDVIETCNDAGYEDILFAVTMN